MSIARRLVLSGAMLGVLGVVCGLGPGSAPSLASAGPSPPGRAPGKPVEANGLDPADRSLGFDRPPEGCLDMDDPRLGDPDDPRRRKYHIEICCLDPADSRAQNPDDPRRRKYRAYRVHVCGPDVQALTAESLRRHALPREEAEVRVELLGRTGEHQVRTGRLTRTQAGGAEEEMKLEFVSPADVAGVALRSVRSRAAGAEQWLSLPAFGSVRRVGLPELGESFAGTDFLFADLRRLDPEDFDFYFRESEGSGADEMLVFSLLPHDELGPGYPYGALRVWLRRRDLFISKLQMYDRTRHPWREIRFEDVVEVAPGVERANKIVGMDSRRHHWTIITTTRRSLGRG